MPSSARAPQARATLHRSRRIAPGWPHPAALDVVRRLKRHGYETYFAGGCVRDFLLAIPPRDFDIATAAGGRTVDALFFPGRTGRWVPAARTLPSGDDITIDILSFGAPPWADHAQWRRQRKAEQSSPAEAFIKSFDYTMNALYYDPAADVIIDFVHGVDDIRTRTLRLVRPDEFRLDVVSVLRGITHCSQKDLHIDAATWEAMCRWASRGDMRSKRPARVFAQVVRMLGSGVAAPCVGLLQRMGAMPLFLGRNTLPDGELSTVRRLLAALDRVCAPGLRVAMLFATLFYHPIALALGRTGAALSRPRLPLEAGAAHLALSNAIESTLRPLAEPFAMPAAIYRETHQILLAVHLMRVHRTDQPWRGAEGKPWWHSATLLRSMVRDAAS